jgi:hypothetical protein
MDKSDDNKDNPGVNIEIMNNPDKPGTNRDILGNNITDTGILY